MIERPLTTLRIARGVSDGSGPAAGSRIRPARIAVTVLLATGITLAGPVFSREPADRIRHGGTVLTMNDKAMRAEAVAERGGRIVAVGSKAAVSKLEGPPTQMIDLKGRTLLRPGSSIRTGT